MWHSESKKEGAGRKGHLGHNTNQVLGPNSQIVSDSWQQRRRMVNPVVARRVARVIKHASKSAASTSNWCWDENSSKPWRRGQTIRASQIHQTSVFHFRVFFFIRSHCSIALELQFVQVMLHCTVFSSLPSAFFFFFLLRIDLFCSLECLQRIS